MEWFEELSFGSNPFGRETKTVGYEEVLEEADYAIVSGNMVFIQDNAGNGKTKVLREVIRKFGGHGKIIYVDCATLEKELNVERLLKDANGFMGKVFNQKPKNMVLLLDNVQHLSARNSERIKYYFDQNFLRSVIFTGDNFEKLGLPESLKHRMHKVITLPGLTDYEAVQIVRDKIGYDLLTDRVLKQVWKASGKSIREYLKNAEKVCKEYAKNKEVKEEDLGRILAVQAAAMEAK